MYPCTGPGIARVPGLKSLHSAAIRGYGDGGDGAAGVHHWQAVAGYHAPQSELLVHFDMLLIGSAMNLYSLTGAGGVDGVLDAIVAAARTADREVSLVGEVLVYDAIGG